MATTTTTKTKQTKGLDLFQIQSDIAGILRMNVALEASRSERLMEKLETVSALEADLKVAKGELAVAIANDAATQRIAEGVKRLDGLKMEAGAAFNNSVVRSWMDADGAGFQFRTKAVTKIADQPALAKHLADHNLWIAAGAELTVDPKLVGALLEKTSLPGVALDVDVTVALYKPKEN